MTPARSPLFRLLHFLAAALLAATGAAQADDYGAITRLIQAGQPAQALAQIDERLAATPKDPQLRFLRGVAQTDAGQAPAAIETFTRLTQDYPELPEPYNNLAVLYAQGDELDKARAALEMAVRANPRYATALENLGDVYARLAADAWRKALAQGGANTTALQAKLALARQLAPAQR